MENYLQEIRAEHPGLNPTETYKRLSEAITSDVVEEKVDYEMHCTRLFFALFALTN